MSIVNFLEIPKANRGGKDQDAFELFGRDFLERFGFKVLQHPARGADSGRDLIVQERRLGIAGETDVTWLVSCKHFAHSGKAVGVEDESSVLERVKAAKTDGFLGFYSTLPSSGLSTRLRELENDLVSMIFDSAKIEDQLVTASGMASVFARYFPQSYAAWKVANPKRAELLFEDETLACECCGCDLLRPEKFGKSILVMWRNYVRDKDEPEPFDTVYCCCKGKCDHALREKYGGQERRDRWEELKEFTIPTLYIINVMNIQAWLNDGYKFTDEALAKLRRILILAFHHVSRDLTDREREIVKLNINTGCV